MIALYVRVSSFVLILLGCFITDASGQVLIQQRLLEVSKGLAKYESELQKIVTEEKKLNDIMDESSNKIEAVRIEKLSLDKRMQRVERSLERLEMQSRNMVDNLGNIKLRLRSRLKSVYVSRRGDTEGGYLVSAMSGTDVVKLGYFFSKIQKKDLKLVKRLKALLLERKKKRAALQSLYSTRQGLKDSLLAEEERERELLIANEKAHALVLKKQHELERARDKVKSEYIRLEKILSALTGKKDIYVSVNDSDQVEKNKKGLSHYVSWPVKGKILRGYGRYRVAKFNDVVFHKGVLFDVEQGGKVKALEEGVISFIGVMPNHYGRVILIDHGKRYYTLYGRLQSVEVKVGDVVHKDANIAVVGEVKGSAAKEPDSEKAVSLDLDTGNFYFEVRKQGQSVNPRIYIQ
jgi:septal ring factor EnvC (AmiA/AmiB activator)